MGRSVNSLFRPFGVKGLSLPNRIVMAAMTRYKSPGGIPGADVAAYYRRRAENNCGLIITEGTTINTPVACGYPNVPFFWGDALKGWKRVVDEVHDAGGKIMPQIWHCGQVHTPGCPNFELPAATPSGFGTGFCAETKCAPMTKQEIKQTVDAFARAAADAREIGFDGVQVHCAHGYLVDTFFWEGMNKRTDEYGGSIEKRTQMGVEIIEAIRREAGKDFPLSIRISQFKQQDFDARLAQNPEELARFLKPLSDAGVDIFDCSQRRYWEPGFEGSDLTFPGWVKKLSGKPVITVGSVTLAVDLLSSLTPGVGYHDGVIETSPIDPLLERLEADEFDLVAVGRAILVDHAWGTKVREGRFSELKPFSKEARDVLY